MSIAAQLERMATEAHAMDALGPWSTGEKLAVALVLHRVDWLDAMEYSMLEAVDRIGYDWLQASIRVARSRR